MTLHDVERISRGAFKPSTIAGYERGERMISLERFRILAELYRVPADRLLADALEGSRRDTPDRLVIDVGRLGRVPEPERSIVAEHVHGVRTRRGDFLNQIVTLRTRDLEVIALATRLNPRVALARLRPALAGGRGRNRASVTQGKIPTTIDSSSA